MTHPATTYAAQLSALLPRGRLFSDLGENLSGLLEAWAEELARVDAAADAAFAETEPTTAEASLVAWEDLYGLPSTGTLEERRARAAARRYKRSRTRVEDYQARMAGVLGIDAADVHVEEVSHILITGEREVYRFFIYRDPRLGGTFAISDADALLYDYAQSHTVGTVTERMALRAGDPRSRIGYTPLDFEGNCGVNGAGWIQIDDATGAVMLTTNEPTLWDLPIPQESALRLALSTDDDGAIYDGSGYYATVPNRGTLGGSIISASGPGPAVAKIAERSAALTTTNGGFEYGSTSSLNFVHSPGSSATIIVRFRLDNAAGGVLAGNKSAGSSARGIRLIVSFASGTTARLFVNISDGTTQTTLGTSATNTEQGAVITAWFRKTGSAVELSTGGTVVSGTFSSASSANAAEVFGIGSYSDDSTKLPGALMEFLAWEASLSDEEIAEVTASLANKWGTR